LLVFFYVRKEFFDAFLKKEKKIELRIGEKWLKIAEKAMKSEKPVVALIKWGSKTLIREIWKVEIYPNIRTALGSGRWKLLGLKAKTYPEAIDEVRKLYAKSKGGKVILFWLRQPKNKEQLMKIVNRYLSKSDFIN